jgi:GNAT superfamily N-acetyltransferase
MVRNEGPSSASMGERSARHGEERANRAVDRAAAPRVREAGAGDVATVVGLVNAAYVVEALLVRGERIDAAGVDEHRRRGLFLLLEQDLADRGGASAGAAWSALGCVYVQPRGQAGYLGLLSVLPDRQGEGLGDLLLRAGEERLSAAGCREVEILVVSERAELFPWYEKRGYARTGRTLPFGAPDRLLQPCHFVEMRKVLRAR